MTFCRRQQDESVDSIRQESQLYIAEDNKDADGSVDSEGADYIFPKEKHALIHGARIRRELIL